MIFIVLVFHEYNLCSRRDFSLQMRTGQQVSDLTEKINVTVPIAFAAKVEPNIKYYGEHVNNGRSTRYYCSSTSSRNQFDIVERVTERYPNPMFGLTLKMEGRKEFYYQSYLTLPKCRLLCEVDYESMPSSSIFRCSL